ncbi:MAG: hypothetical protein QOF58_3487 [Pseudonocardiales bacterium]|nr:hypothetical protein [Pseudonocardiales bacterium]
MFEDAEGGPPTSMAGRIACILRLFAEEPEPKRLADLHHGTRLPWGTVHRMAGDLVSNGLLDRDEDGRYDLGPLLRRIAGQLAAANAAS